jgi:hypothetical protein
MPGWTRTDRQGKSKKRENMKKIYDAIKYLNKYKNRNLDTLMGSSISFDNEQTWIGLTVKQLAKQWTPWRKMEN